jgi:DnaJ-domain-containing protein 1
MSAELYNETLKICQRHSDRLRWSMHQLQPHIPFTANMMNGLTDIELAVLDQFSTRFSKLQDTMGEKLSPVVLELTKEQGNLLAFVDRLHRLEKIGAIPSADNWLLLREMRNAFSHEYPDDLALQAAILNKAFELAAELISILDGIKVFAARYL